MGNLATVIESQDRYPESEKLEREVLEKCTRVLGLDHPSTALALYNIADILYYERRYSEAATLLRQTVEIERRALGAGHPDTVDSVYKLARVLALTHQPDEAITVLADVVDCLDAKTLAELEKDTDLKSLRGNPRFEALLAKAEKHAAEAAQKTN
jgi:tetratricopeptide (TPR) repeat protein